MNKLWAIAIIAGALAITVSSYTAMRYRVEKAQQQTTQLQACNDSGGDWKLTIFGRPKCKHRRGTE